MPQDHPFERLEKLLAAMQGLSTLLNRGEEPLTLDDRRSIGYLVDFVTGRPGDASGEQLSALHGLAQLMKPETMLDPVARGDVGGAVFILAQYLKDILAAL